jgi:diguanylate cyclase (GGDEF)-like protein
MKSCNTLYRSRNELEKFIAEKSLEDSKSLLIQVYSGMLERKKVQEVLNILKEFFPDSSLVGATTAGEIVCSRIYEQNIAVSFTYFDTGKLQAGRVDYEDFSKIATDNNTSVCFEAGKFLCNKIKTEDTKLILLLADGIQTNGEELARGFDTDASIILGGGLAADNGHFKNTYVFLNNEIIEKGCVAVSINSKELKVFNHYSTGWKPIGRKFIVTKSQKNIVYELDGKPIYEVYREYLGEEVANNLPHSAIEFPLMIDKNDRYIARAAMVLNEDKSLVFAGNVSVGSAVRFGYGNSILILDLAGKLIENEFFKRNIESLFIFSCVARKRFLGKNIETELRPFVKVAPNIGFFTYGEFFSHKYNELLNESVTLIASTENEKAKEINIYDKDLAQESASVRAINALMNLVEKTTKELEVKNASLEKKSKIDQMTGFYNRYATFSFMNKFLEEDASLALLVIDLDGFKQINDSCGHLLGDKVLIECTKAIRKSIRKLDIAGRYGGDEFMVVFTDISKEKALEKAEEILENIRKISIKYDDKILKISVSIGVSLSVIGDDVSSLIERADQALYKAKRNGKNQVKIVL